MMNDQAKQFQLPNSSLTKSSSKQKGMKKQFTLLALLLLLIANNLSAQTFTHYLSRLSSTDRMAVYNACYDKQGNGYIAGWYKGSVTFGGVTYDSYNGESDPFIAKVDTLGNWKWFLPIRETSDNGVAFDVAVDTSLNVYVVGSVDSAANALGTQQSNSNFGIGNTSLFLIKVIQNGNTPSIAWFKGSHEVYLVNETRGATVAVDKSQNIIVASVHTGSSDYTPSFAGEAFANNNINVAFVWKFNQGGAVVSKWESNGTNVQLIEDMGLDKSGNVFVTARYETYNDSIQLAPGFNFINSAGRYAYGAPLLIKLNNALSLQWARAEWTLTQSDFYDDLAVDTNGNAYVFCTHDDTVKIGSNYFFANAGYLKQAVLYGYNANGSFNFIKKYANTGGDVESNRVTCDADNKMVISADLYSGVNSIEGVIIGDRSFVARVNPSNGNILTVRTVTNDNINTIALATRRNNVLLAGSNYAQGDPLQFNGSALALPALSSGSEAAYVVEFAEVPLTTGIEEFPTLDVAFSVVPNPAKGYMNLQVAENSFENLRYSVIDITGRVVANAPLTTNITSIDIAALNPGMYHVVVQSEGLKTSKRIIVQ